MSSDQTICNRKAIPNQQKAIVEYPSFNRMERNQTIDLLLIFMDLLMCTSYMKNQLEQNAAVLRNRVRALFWLEL